MRIASCKAGKLKRFAWILVTCMLVCACTQHEECVDTWDIYCAKYAVDPNNPSEKQVNYYLDAYVGSVEEENDLSI